MQPFYELYLKFSKSYLTMQPISQVSICNPARTNFRLLHTQAEGEFFLLFFSLPALHNQSQTLDSRVCQENLFSHLKAKSTQKSARITPGGLKVYFQPEKKVLQKRKFSAL